MVFDTFSKGGGKPSPRIRCFTPCLCYTYIDRLLLSVLSILYLFIDCFRLFEGSLELDSVLLIQMRVQDRTCSWLLGFLTWLSASFVFWHRLSSSDYSNTCLLSRHLSVLVVLLEMLIVFKNCLFSSCQVQQAASDSEYYVPIQLTAYLFCLTCSS
jgi:hypothetical protein